MSKKSSTGKKLFIRFNELPENGQSFIYDENNIICGRRAGVSVYDAIKVDGVYTPKLPRYASKETVKEFNKYTYDNTSGKYDKMYLVTGDLVTEDERHCPIITNVEIIDELNFDEVFPGRRITEDMASTPIESVEKPVTDTPMNEDTNTEDPKTNRIDDFVENIKETAHQVSEEVRAGFGEATSEVNEFLTEVRESKVAADLHSSITDTKDRVIKTTKQVTRFAKAFAKASTAFVDAFIEKDKDDD